MTEAISDMDFDEDFFSPEELAMMNGSDGETEALFVTPTIEELQTQLQEMATQVNEGCEREQELRVLVKGLRAAQGDDDTSLSLQSQAETLAKLVIASCERERVLQQSIADMRKLFSGSSAIDR